jgi:hypothetical protein
MKLWTLQPLEVYRDLQTQRVLAADPARGDGEDFAAAYAWLCGQMARRVPGYGGGPVWWASARKPDLRAERHHYAPDDWVRLELDVPDEEVLLSDLHGWYFVLSRWYVPVDDADHEAFGARLDAAGGHPAIPTCPDLAAEVERSWERIFDPGPVTEGLRDGTLQATFEWLRLGDVRRVTHFRGCHLRKFFGPLSIGPDDLPPLEGFGDSLRVGDRFASNSSGGTAEAIYILRGYERRRKEIRLVCEDERGRPTEFNASGLGWSRRFRRLPPAES